MFKFKVPMFGRLFYRYCSSVSVLTVKETLLTKPVNSKVKVQGWVQAVRLHKGVYFVDLVDGTCVDRLQIIIDAEKKSVPSYGSSIKAVGSIIESSHKGQEIELVAESWSTIGPCAESYPFIDHQKFSPEFIRQHLHLRPRTRRFSSVLRIRNHASMAVHKYFQDEGFCFVHTPVITLNDCEGAGEVFTIETVKKVETMEKLENKTTDQNEVKKEDPLKSESSLQSNSNPIQEEKFFGSPAYLTVSGQLHLEALAQGLSRVYNFGPAFRAEGSQTRLHASEFQMIEAEIAFVDSVDDLLKSVENCIKKITETILSSCRPEIYFLSKEIKQHHEYLNNILEKPFVRMSYKDAISILEKHNKSLKTPIKFGDDLATAHKQFLVRHCDNIPVFVSMFPSSIKPFYMKEDEDKMAYCFDLFAAYGGEICGGSLRKDDELKLKEKFPLDISNLQWYLDLRKYGSVPHGGFGIGFDRLLQSILGFSNIRDIIPFPRRRFDCKC